MKRILIVSVLVMCPVTAFASVLMPGAKVEKVTDGFDLADGPAWDGMSALYVPDVKGQKLWRYVTRTGKKYPVLTDAGRISATFFSHGKLFLSENSAARIAWLKGKEKVGIAGQDPNAKPPARPNDLVVDVNGGIYYTLTRQNQVVYIAPDGKQRVVVEKIETPNGIILSPDGRTLYVAAYVPKEIWAYDVDSQGSTSKARVFSRMDDGPDRGADGMTIDRAGNVYCAGPKHVWVWSPSGKLLDRIETPTRPINCAFAGPDPQQLYITCLPDPQTKQSAIYRIATRIAGVSPHPSTTKVTPRGNSKRPVTEIPGSIFNVALNVSYAQYGDRRVLMDVFVPEGKGMRPAIVVVHGGGWLKGDKTKFRALAVQLAARGYVTAAIEYRLGHEARFPAGIHDCNAAVRFLRANALKFHINPKRIGAVGGSAGGHLVGLMATGSNIKQLQGEGGWPDRSSRLQAAIVMAGPMEIDTGSVAERSRAGKANSNFWIGGSVDDNLKMYQLASAHRHIDKDSSPILFMVGEHDNPSRNQPSRDKLKAAGVWTDLKVYKDGKHGCWNQLPWFNDMVADMDAFFKEKLK